MSENNAPTGTVANTVAGRMLCASGLAYSIPTTPTIIGPPATVPTTAPFYSGAGYQQAPFMIQNGTAACTVGMNQDGIVVTFRGTVYNDPMDWIKDLMVLTRDGANLPGRVHRGFYDDLMTIINEITSAISRLLTANPSSTIFLTGHSKGGGMAPIAAYYLQANCGITAPMQVFLYAPPNCGNSSFASGYNSQFPKTYAYENYQDIVPIIPPTPAIGTEMAAYLVSVNNDFADALAALLVANDLEDYSAVGTDNNIMYIQQPVGGLYSMEQMGFWVRERQVLAVLEVINSGDLSVFENAHNHNCGYGYMSAICPEVCG